MMFTAWPDGRFELGPREVRCALGRGGVTDAPAKFEGDGKSPAGVWPIRRVVWRPDRGPKPQTVFPCEPIGPHDGWCDDAADPESAVWRHDRGVRTDLAERSAGARLGLSQGLTAAS